MTADITPDPAAELRDLRERLTRAEQDLRSAKHNNAVLYGELKQAWEKIGPAEARAERAELAAKHAAEEAEHAAEEAEHAKCCRTNGIRWAREEVAEDLRLARARADGHAAEIAEWCAFALVVAHAVGVVPHRDETRPGVSDVPKLIAAVLKRWTEEGQP